MKKALLIVLAAFIVRANAQMSLTPGVSERTQEGLTFPQLVFSDGGKKVTYEQPRGWIYSSESKQKIALYPPHKSLTKAKIESGFPVVPSQFEEENLKQLKQLFLTLLPKDSELVVIVAEQKNLVRINGRDSYEITAAFVNHVQKYCMSVLFANLEREQLRFTVIADFDDFGSAHRAFIESLYGLQWRP